MLQMYVLGTLGWKVHIKTTLETSCLAYQVPALQMHIVLLYMVSKMERNAHVAAHLAATTLKTSSDGSASVGTTSKSAATSPLFHSTVACSASSPTRT